MTNQKRIAGKPRKLTVNQLMIAGAEGDSAAINILDMIDNRELIRDDQGKFDEKRIAQIYNATIV